MALVSLLAIFFWTACFSTVFFLELFWIQYWVITFQEIKTKKISAKKTFWSEANKKGWKCLKQQGKLDKISKKDSELQILSIWGTIKAIAGERLEKKACTCN